MLLPTLEWSWKTSFSPPAVGLSQQYLEDQALEQMGERSRGRNSILLYDCFLQSGICKSCLHMKNIKASRGVEGGLSKTSEELPCSPNVLLGAYVPSWTLFACLGLGLAAAQAASCKTTPRRISLPGDQAPRMENWMDKVRGALLGSNKVVTAIQLPCSTSLCCLLL